jgi:hypothetical protein
MTISTVNDEVHPTELVTVKEYVPGSRPDTVRVVPVPWLVKPSGFLVSVQVPLDGSPDNTTLPVATVKVGCVIVPTTGAVGVGGWVLITAFADTAELHPLTLVTAKLYVPAPSVEIVVLVPVPVEVMPPGYLVNVHSPVAGMFSRRMLPVASPQVGCVMVPMTGANGVSGWGMMTTCSDAGEIHPAALATVNVYVPDVTPVTVRVVPVPLIATPPGERVRVHVPVAGSPLIATLPVESAQVGWVIVPITGAEGVSGCALITTLADAGDMQPSELVTVKVNVPAVSPETVVLVPEPVVVVPPGVRVMVQSPVAGRLLSITLPSGLAQDGCVTVPGTGAAGLAFTVRV